MPATNEAVARAGAESSTLYVAIEISAKSWVVGINSPTSARIGLHSLGAADVDALRELVERQRAKAERALGGDVRVLCCYEAGYEGFWLARWLDRWMSVETVVLDPASILVNRKAKQRKTDRIDAKKMVRALLAHDRGDAAVLSRVRVPSVEEEDRKRLLRERQRLVKERTSLTNSIKGLLRLHGIFDLQPRSNGFGMKFAEARTAYASPFPPRARQEVLRLSERLFLVERQIAQVEAERDAVARSGAELSIAELPEGSDAQAAAKIASLTRLRGIGGERRDPADERGLLPEVQQSPGAGELGRHDADALGERRHGTRPRDRPGRSRLDSGPARSNGVALVAPSARQRAFGMV